jgi:hypothetical protein
MWLQNVIIKQDAHVLDDTSREKFERHILKLLKLVNKFLLERLLGGQSNSILKYN